MYISSYYKYSSEKNFDFAVAELIGYIANVENVVRIVFFSSPSDTDEFIKQRSTIVSMLGYQFSDSVPAYTYLSQPLLESGTLGVEIQVVKDCEGAVWEYPKYDMFNYVKITIGKERMLFLPGIYHSDLSLSVREQSEMIMSKVSNILLHEGFTFSNIVRQWNYIENITGKEIYGRQRYQEFNDVRSNVYGSYFIGNGYPAATGIGTQHGGVQIELDVLSDTKLYSSPIDNPGQVSAYDYSNDVLVGSNDITTPKFERARSVLLHGHGWIYISGTAAIRGEESLGDNAFDQTSITLDNIELLISEQNLKTYDVVGKAKLSTFRVYVKDSGDLNEIKECISCRYPDINVIYVNADICRDNLFVEIEALALIIS